MPLARARSPMPLARAARLCLTLLWRCGVLVARGAGRAALHQDADKAGEVADVGRGRGVEVGELERFVGDRRLFEQVCRVQAPVAEPARHPFVGGVLRQASAWTSRHVWAGRAYRGVSGIPSAARSKAMRSTAIAMAV